MTRINADDAPHATIGSPNFTFDRIDGSHSFGAAGQRAR